MVAWARAHFQDPWPLQPACTNFVSRALRNGFGMRFRTTPAWLGWQFQLARYRDNHYWWYLASPPTLHTFSWAAATNLNEFLSMHNIVSQPYFASARPGDVVFFDKMRDGRQWDHAAVITKMLHGVPFVTEQQDNHRDRSLMTIWREHRPSIRILRVNFV